MAVQTPADPLGFTPPGGHRRRGRDGGRVLVLTAHGQDLEEATARAYEACARVTFQDAYFRPDIAQRPAPVLTAAVVN